MNQIDISLLQDLQHSRHTSGEPANEDRALIVPANLRLRHALNLHARAWQRQACLVAHNVVAEVQPHACDRHE